MEFQSDGLHNICRIKVTLLESDPPIWRRFEVSDDITLRKLHSILQAVMGWENSHLYEFYKGKNYLSKTLTLSQVAPRARSKIFYLYDMGDSWEHEILVEKVIRNQEGKARPVCLEGQMACPPEDCGGIWGYDEMLAAMEDPDHPDREHWLEWIGDDFDPAAFDLEAVNKRLRRFKP